jgi:hypothetical protein
VAKFYAAHIVLIFEVCACVHVLHKRSSCIAGPSPYQKTRTYNSTHNVPVCRCVSCVRQYLHQQDM